MHESIINTINLYRALVHSLNDVTQAMSAQGENGQTQIDKPLMKSFITNYFQLASAMANQTMLSFFYGSDNTVKISDATEFIQTLYPLLGITKDSQKQLKIVNALHFFSAVTPNGPVGKQKMSSDSTFIPFLAIRNKQPTMNGCFDIESFYDPLADDDIKHFVEEYEQNTSLKLPHINNITKHVEWHCESEPPGQISFAVRVFQLNDYGAHTKTQTTIKLDDQRTATVDTGNIILRNLITNAFQIQVNIHCDKESKIVQAAYEVETIICHIGASPCSGHYTTLQYFPDSGQLVYYNDAQIELVVDSSATMEELKTCGTQFVESNRLCGYVYMANLLKVSEVL